VSLGVPDKAKLRATNEMYRNPTFWNFEAGLLVSGPDGEDVSAFDYSAVFVPVPDVDTGKCVRPVHHEVFSGDSEGTHGESDYFRLADATYTGIAMASDELQVYNGPELIATMQRAIESSELSFKTHGVAAPPGSGKTYEIKNSVDFSQHNRADVVLTPVRRVLYETKKAISRVSSRNAVAARTRVRTLDSYLVNYGLSRVVQAMKCDTLWCDEAYMAASGRWYAAAALLGAKRVLFYGDPEQIPPVVRAGAPKAFLRVVPETTERRYEIYRCLPGVLACIAHRYGCAVRTRRANVPCLRHIQNHMELPLLPGEVVAGFYQDDKKELKKMYANHPLKPTISTVHELQGMDVEHMRLHKFHLRSRVDGMGLYDMPSYVIVAISRTRGNFTYVSNGSDDLVLQWLKRGQDPRRVAAVMDVETLGVSKEFI